MFIYRKKKRTKLDPFGKKGIFVGYYEVFKAFKIYIPGFHHMEIDRDVTFDEEAALNRSRKFQHEEVYEEDAPPRNVEATFLPEDSKYMKIMIWQNHKNPLQWKYHERESLLGQEKLYKKQKDMELLKVPQG